MRAGARAQVVGTHELVDRAERHRSAGFARMPLDGARHARREGLVGAEHAVDEAAADGQLVRRRRARVDDVLRVLVRHRVEQPLQRLRICWRWAVAATGSAKFMSLA